jgi:recombination protein RecR
MGENGLQEFEDAVAGMRTIKPCRRCFFVYENGNPVRGNRASGVSANSNGVDGLCDICRDPRRVQGVIMVVEKETDLLSLENSGKFTGRYFIVGEIPKTGVLEEWQKLRLQQLKSFIQKELGGKADEIILGFNPTSMGDFNASLVSRELEPFAKKLSRLGRGLPTGGEIEFADDETLGSALERRN